MSEFPAPPALCWPLWHSTYEVSRKKGFCSPAPQVIAEFPPKVGHSICLSWRVRGRSGLAFVGHQGSLQKDGTRQRACALHYLLHVLSGKVAAPSPATPFWFTSAGARRLGVLLVHLGRQSQNLLHQVATMSSGRFSRFCNSGGPRHWAGAAIVSGTPVPCPLCNVLVPSSSTAVNIPEARAAPAWIGSRPRSVSALSGSRCGCGGCGGASSQLRMSLIAASVSGSLCPFLACPSHVCLGGGVPGAVEGGRSRPCARAGRRR